MSIKSLKDTSAGKSTPKQDKEKISRKLEEDKLKHQAVIRFSDLELESLDRVGLVYNGKVDNRRLREFILSKI
jgi:hypothetical protein